MQLEAQQCGVHLDASAGHMLTAASQVWNVDITKKSNKRDSSYVRDIANTALGLGFAIVHEDTSSGYAVDIGIPALRVAIEADGPTHRSRNTRQLLGGTVIKQRHVRAAGWQLLNIGHDKWDQLSGKQQKQTYLQSQLNGLHT